MKRKIMVIGMSSFGSYLSRKLIELGCQVFVLDKDPIKIEEIQDAVDQAAVVDITERRPLDSLQIEDFDVVVLSIGRDIGASTLALLHLKERKVVRVVTKAISEDHARILEKMGASEVIFPERDMASRVAHSLAGRNVIDYLPLEGEYSIMEIVPDKRFIGKSLKELDVRNRFHLEVIAVRQSVPEETTLIPGSSFVVKESDLLVVAGKNEDLQRLEKH